MRKRYAKLSIGTSDVLKQTICKIKLRRAPTLHDNIEYADCDMNVKKIIIFSIAARAADDNKDSYVLVREKLHAFSVIPTRYEDKSMKGS